MKRKMFTAMFFYTIISTACGGRSATIHETVPTDAVASDDSVATLPVQYLDKYVADDLVNDLRKKIGNEYVISRPEESSVKATRIELGADGQRMRENSETLVFHKDKDTWTLVPTQVTRTLRNETRVSDLILNEFRFYASAVADPIQLIFTEAVLRNSMWRKYYQSSDNIPGRIESERRPYRKYQYTAWVKCDENKACRLPVWVYDGVWVKEEQGEVALVAGEITVLHDPSNRHLEKDSFFYVMRLNDRYEASNRGILYPISESTYLRFVDYSIGKTNDWTRDYAADDKESYIDMAMLDNIKNRLHKVPISEVSKRPEIKEAPIEQRPKGCCVPDFNETGPLF